MARPRLRDPLYRRVVAPRAEDSWLQNATSTVAPYLPLIYLFGGVSICCALSSHAQVLIAVVAIVVLFNCTFYAVNWSARIAGQIAAERESGAWELLCLMPTGAMGAVWAIITGVSHRDNAFPRRFQRHVGVLTALLAICLLMLPCFLLDYTKPNNFTRPDTIVLYAYLLVGLLVSYVDYVQSAVLGSLIGVFGGLQADSPLDAQFLAGGIFLALQAGVYTVIVLFCFVLLPPIPTELDGPRLIVEGLLLLARLAFFVGVHELVIAVVWRLVTKRLPAGDLTPPRRAS